MLQAKTRPQFSSAGADKSTDDTSLFLTAEFQGSVTSLANINSLSLLLDMIGRTLGINKAMDDNPYVRILLNSAKSTKYTPGDPNQSAANDFVNLWHAEVLYRTLLQVVPKNIADPALLRNLVSDFTSKLRNTQKHNNSYSIYSDKFISYMRTTLSHTFACDDAKFPSQFDAHTIASNSLHTLECMSAYFSRIGNEKLCMLLSFFGATYNAKSSTEISSEILSSTVLKNTLKYDLELDHMCAGVTSQNADEIRNRKAISDALFSEITSIHSKIENIESSLHKRCKWYHFISLISKFFLSTFTIRKLYNSLETIKNLDVIFRNSIAFGDCAAFFLELGKVEKTSKNAYTSPLFRTLSELQKAYKPLTHSEYVSSVKNCFVSSIPTQVFPLSAGRTSGLHNIKKVGISSACKRTSVRVNGLLNRILGPSNSEKPSPDAIVVSHFSPLFGTKQFSGSLSHKGTLQHTDKKNRGRLSTYGVRLISEVADKKMHLLSSISKVLKNKNSTHTASTAAITNSAANDSPCDELLATSVRPMSETAHKKVRLLFSASKVLKKKKYKKAERAAQKALKIKNKEAIGTSDDSTEAITYSAANDSPGDELLTTSVLPVSEVSRKKVHFLSSASKALKSKYKKAKRTAQKALHIKNKKATDTADDSTEAITYSAANDSPGDELPTTDALPISEVAHKKEHLPPSVSKTLNIENTGTTHAAPTEAITYSAANDSPSDDLPTADALPISEVAHKKEHLLPSVSQTLNTENTGTTHAAPTEAVTYSAANDSPGDELPTAGALPISEVAHKKEHLPPSVSKTLKSKYKKAKRTAQKALHLKNKKATGTDSTESITNSAANDLPGDELPITGALPISEVAHKKMHFLSSISKALHIKNKKAKGTDSTESITNSAANDLPSGKLLATNVRPISEAAHKKMNFLSSVSKALSIK